MVRLDDESKAVLTQAAELRQISLSDYVRAVIVPQARREVEAADRQLIALTPDEQIALATALSQTPRLTVAQKQVGKIMREQR